MLGAPFVEPGAEARAVNRARHSARRRGWRYDWNQRPFVITTPCGVPGGGVALNSVS